MKQYFILILHQTLLHLSYDGCNALNYPLYRQ